MEEINFKKIEKKWQDKWEKGKIFQVKEGKKKKYYVLEMYPYPSASFLHMGHVRNYTIGDVYARFKRMNGFNVLYPMGYDSFGLPAETAAKKEKIHPKKYAEESIKKIIQYQKSLGNSYDWSRVLASHDIDYYKWNQYFFLKLYEKGLAYRKKAPVNWCPECESVLANEEAEGGRCWRCENEVIKKDLEQWFFKITAYADRLLEDLKKIQWPEKIKIMQKNWIGKSYGSEIDFEIESKSISNAVIVHGSPSRNDKSMNPKTRTYDKHWIPWIRSELEKKGIKTETPLMPNPWEPNYVEWKKEFEKLDINENSVLVGHSAGGGFLVRWLGETERKIKKLILVAPAIIHFGWWKPLENLLRFNINKNLKENVKEIIIFASKDDSKGILKAVDIFEKELNATMRWFKDMGHFTNEKGRIMEFLELLNEILYQKWPIFTTRPDTIYGVTFMVISAQHPKLFEIVTSDKKNEVKKFADKCNKARSEEEIENLEKEGVFTGSYAINPLTSEKVPVYAGNFVLADYGSGMVMAVPGHDQRDFDFAKKYKIPIKEVIKGRNIKEKVYIEKGILVNSAKFNGLDSEKAKEEITKYLEQKKLGRKTINYKLRDWLISRQRYWGTPIPIIYCEKCGIVPVPEKDLPVKLPEKVDFKSKSNPLASNSDFVNVKCPKCKGKAKRETDTMGGFVDSSWYFLRYCDNKNKKKAFDNKKVNYWMPVDQYVGGAEHAVMHLMYARFFVKALKDLGFVNFDEPFMKLFNQGIVYKDGAKMSKSKGNIVFQTDISNKYGIDTARLFLMFVTSPDKQMEWSDAGIEGSFRIINRLIRLKDKIQKNSNKKEESKINLTIKTVTENIENFEYPKAIVPLTGAIDYFSEGISKNGYGILLKLMSPFCPHIAEELWEKTGNKNFISLEKWPKADEKKIDMRLEKQEQQIEDLANDINNILKIVKSKNQKVSKGYVYCLPNELKIYEQGKQVIEKKTTIKIEIYAVNDKNKYDPENKSKRARPGKPAIYLEQK